MHNFCRETHAYQYNGSPNEAPPKPFPPQELKLASFHELACVSKLAEGIYASLSVRPFIEGYTRHFR